MAPPLSLARRRRAAEREENHASRAESMPTATAGLLRRRRISAKALRGAAAFELREKVELEQFPGVQLLVCGRQLPP